MARFAGLFAVFVLLIVIILFPRVTWNKKTLTLDLGQISVKNLEFFDTRILISKENDGATLVQLFSSRLNLPAPFDNLRVTNVHCKDIAFSLEQSTCRQGTGQLTSPWLKLTPFEFFFQSSEESTDLTLHHIKEIGGTISLRATQQEEQWLLKLNAHDLNALPFAPFFNRHRVGLNSGTVSLSAEVSFNLADTELESDPELTELRLMVSIEDATIQTEDGLYASEALESVLTFNASPQNQQWHWDTSIRFSSGELYVEPVYIESPELPITLNAKGLWEQGDKAIELTDVSFAHPNIGSVEGQFRLLLRNGIELEDATVLFKTENLQGFDATYLQPFIEGTPLEGFELKGELNARVILSQQTLTEAHLHFPLLEITDVRSRVSLESSSGTIHWSNQRSARSQTNFGWEKLAIYRLPIGRSELSLTTDKHFVQLNESVDLPTLGGKLLINQFDWLSGQGQEPILHFQGEVQDVSLAQLSAIQDWPKLQGSFSGRIPEVTYHQGRIETSGGLKAKLFDGEIKIKNLVLADLLSNQSKLFADISIDNLDLQQVTQTFKAGEIKGRLSGFVNELQLVDWKPVTFFAWLGTPEADDSQHEISQQALNDISSIGSGPGVGLLSTTFLGYFDSFRYDELGMGCYLHQGVCQLMGVSAVKQGFYLVKGRGVPRVDIIAYNTTMDWTVLLERLERISHTDEVVLD